MNVSHDDPRLSWDGAISVQRTGQWSQPWRLPHEELDLFPPETLVERAAQPAGVRLAFRSDTSFVGGEIEIDPDATAVDLFVDGEMLGSAPLAGVDRFQFDGIHAHTPRTTRTFELWLPQYGAFRLKSLRLSDGASLSPIEHDRPRWITYGSSITQCRAAASPSQTWPAIVARQRGLDLTCLGYGGQCHLDSSIARIMRDRPATYLSMCVGINIYGSGSLNARSFRPAILGFVRIVREGHPDTPFVVMSPIYSPPRETVKNNAGFTLQEMREEVALAVDALRAHGDKNLHYVNGLDVFGADLAHLLPDDLHPDAEGYRKMGAAFAERVAARYFQA